MRYSVFWIIKTTLRTETKTTTTKKPGFSEPSFSQNELKQFHDVFDLRYQKDVVQFTILWSVSHNRQLINKGIMLQFYFL